MLPDLMNSFEDLVAKPWGSRNELIQIVYGFGLDDLHPDISKEEQQMARHAALTTCLAEGPSVAPRIAPWF